MAHEQACTWIDLVLARADELRSNGVLSITVDGSSATFAPKADPIPEGKIDPPDETAQEGLHPLNDPASYPGGRVPGFHERLDLSDIEG